jgi:hypothetical protein
MNIPPKDVREAYQQGGRAALDEIPTKDWQPSTEEKHPEQAPDNGGFQPIKPLPTPTLSSVRPYRPEMLPEALRPWLCDIAERGQFHFDFLAVSGMAALGGAVGRRCAVYAKRLDNWHEYPNLWACIVGRPGAMKSPSMSATLAPLRRIEKAWAEEYRQDMANFQSAELAAGIKFKAAKMQADKLAKDGKPFVVPEISGLLEPICRRMLTSDPTEAKLGELLSQNPCGLTLELDELALLWAMFERDPALRELMLKSWNGREAHTVDRVGRGTTYIEALCLSVIGGIQPGRLAPMVNAATQSGGGDGLLQRFPLVAYPDGWADEWRNVDRHPDTEAVRMAWEVFERLANSTPEHYPRVSEHGPNGLRFSPAALEQFSEWHEHLHRTLRAGDMTETAEAFLAKQAKPLLGLALLSELADNPNAEEIGTVSLGRALAMLDASESHIARMLEARIRIEIIAAQQIWQRVRRGDLSDGFTARSLKQRNWSGLTDGETVDAALAVLVECGHLRADKINTGGRPSCVFVINPAA